MKNRIGAMKNRIGAMKNRIGAMKNRIGAMKRHTVMLLIVLALLIPPLSAGAQDGGGCSAQSIEMGLALANTLHERIGKALADGDLETAQLESATLTEHLANFYDTCGDIATGGDAAPPAAVDLCATYPLYCVPNIASAMIGESQGTEGVVRGIDAHGFPFIGNPDAPIHFRIVSAPACSHCWVFFLTDIREFIDSEVLTGRATVSYALLTNIGTGSYVGTVNAICAGQQGRFWEYMDAMWSVVDDQGPEEGLSHDALSQHAHDLGLDMPRFDQCTQSADTEEVVNAFQTFANDYGVNSTPTLLVSYGDAGDWERLDDRSYRTMVTMTQLAN